MCEYPRGLRAKLPVYEDFCDYRPPTDPVHCACGGTISMGRNVFNRDECSCDKCGKEFKLYALKYDRLEINTKTGWIFPVVNKEV